MGTTYYDYANTDALTDILAILLVFGYWLIIMATMVSSVLIIIARWKIYTKAGEQGWGSIVPFFTNYLLFKIAWGNGWLFLLLAIPVVGWFIHLVALYKLCAAFGYDVGFFLGMLFLPPVFYMILAFGSSKYHGPA